jgi:ABC-type branched-subunit amino acid transport system substrate-binding protein
MKRWICLLCTIPILWFMSCETTTTESGQQVITVTIGFTTSQTGSNSLVSTRQTNGLNLCINQVNGWGGILLDNGSAVKFESIVYDDAGNAGNVGDFYDQLCTEDNVDFLFSPYSSSLTDIAAEIADAYDKLPITIGAASDSTYMQGYTTVYQTYTPASRYLTGAVDLLAHLDQSNKKVAYVYENTEYSTIGVEAARTYAEGLGYETVYSDHYEVGTDNFGPFIDAIIDNEAEVILGGGHFQDGSDFAQQLNDSEAEIDFLALLVAPPDPEFAELGDAALGVIGPSQWESSVTFSPESAEGVGLEWFGQLGDDFVQAYETAYNEEPSYHSMGGYAAGLILQKAILDAGSVNTEAVTAALDSMDILTCYGRIKFDTSEVAHGLQVGHDMVYIQWQPGEGSGLVKQVVWPLEGATAEAHYPKP